MYTYIVYGISAIRCFNIYFFIFCLQVTKFLFFHCYTWEVLLFPLHSPTSQPHFSHAVSHTLTPMPISSLDVLKLYVAEQTRSSSKAVNHKSAESSKLGIWTFSPKDLKLSLSLSASSSQSLQPQWVPTHLKLKMHCILQ